MFGAFTYLLLGGLLYKLHSEDVVKMEERYRKRAEDMSVEELKAAMRKLGITRLEVTPDDVERIRRI